MTKEERREEKRAKIKALREQLKALTDDQKAAMLNNGLIMTIDGKALSDKNTLLLLFQGVNDPIVGGYRQWQAAGRQVKKGEHGSIIWFPSIRKSENEESEEINFYTGTVFSQSQTEEILNRAA